MSSQDGANRSRRTPRTSQQPRRPENPGRRNQTWDVDPAEIDRYLSGRPSRSEQSESQAPRQASGGSTADQLSRLRNAVGRGRDANEAPEPSRQSYRATPQRASRDAYEDDVESGYDDVYPDEDPYEEAPSTGYDAYEDDDAAWEEPVPAPQRRPARPSTSRASQQQRPTRRYEPEPIDVYEDEELYNDDPYLGYEDDQIDRRPPRSARPTRRPARQRPAMSKPNLPSLTLPKSVTDSPLLADMPSLVMIGMAIVSVALMSFLVSDRLHVLGDTIATHVSASGDPENLRTRDAIWQIPLMAGMIALMNLAAAWFISRIDGFAARFLLAAGLLVHFIAWVALFKYLWN